MDGCPSTIFQIDMALGYVAWGLCVARYVWPRLRGIDRVAALCAIATLHSFRFEGLAFLLPGFVGPALPAAFAAPTAYGDLAAGLLAISVLLTIRVRVLFWPLAWAFNVVGAADLLLAIRHAVGVNLPSVAGQLGAAYFIMMLYVPLLLITHGIGFYLLVRPASRRRLCSVERRHRAAAQSVTRKKGYSSHDNPSVHGRTDRRHDQGELRASHGRVREERAHRRGAHAHARSRSPSRARTRYRVLSARGKATSSS